jgi:thiol:disulfide interchange protein DsbD
MKRTILAMLTVSLVYTVATAQIVKPVKWVFTMKEAGNEQVDLFFKATITSPWHMYGLNIPENGPIPASINFDNPTGYVIVGKPGQSPKPEIIDDKIFNMKLELHSNQVTFTQRIRKTQRDSIIITGRMEYMTCSDMQCVMGDQDFTFRLGGSKNADAGTVADAKETTTAVAEPADTAAPDTAVSAVSDAAQAPPPSASSTSSEKSLWGIFFLALVAGLGGLLTPCVYPMIPMTVSFFLRGNKSRARAISEALVFGFSIVFIYTMIGVLVAVFKNPNAVNNFTTHWISNLIFFFIFITLAASFFGMFEIMLPSGLANKVDKQADKGGYWGAFFMAVAMAILSFSCTGPIVASLLIRASQGDVLEPVIGMAGFSLVFALPFTLFAIFPSWLQGLPKSGSWLNAVKVFFAFVMLAFSLYFLGKIDQSYHLNLISRDLFISVWVVIFTLLGLYLLGKIKFAHDSELTFLGVPRFVFAVVSFSFALYLFTGLFGAELKGLSTILPPSKNPTRAATSQTIMTANPATPSSLCAPASYADFLSLPHGLEGYFDYGEALACAKEIKKPVLVDFVGHTCSNCKKMYSEVWSDPRVIRLLQEKFIVVALYTDDKTKLAEADWVTSTVDGKVKNTIGKLNQDLQVSRFNSNALPLYAIVDGNGNNLAKSYYTYDSDVEKFITWLEEGLQ